MTRKILSNLLIAAFVGGFVCSYAAARNVFAQFIPTGSYQKTCSKIELKDATLAATCREKPSDDKFTGFVPTSLDLIYDCEGDIWNADGKLNCKRNRNSALNRQAQTAFTLAATQVLGRTPQGEMTGGEIYGWIYKMFADFKMAKNFFDGTKQTDAEKVLKLFLSQPKSANLRKAVIDKAFYKATGGNADPTQFAFCDAKIKNGEAWYASVHETLTQEMNKNRRQRWRMIQTAYVTAQGRMPDDGDLKYWMAREDSFGALVEHSRNWLYSPEGAADLVAVVRSVLEVNLKRKPNDEEVKTAVSEYSKKRLIFMEMRGAMPPVYY